jgi:hypothetical protein
LVPPRARRGISREAAPPPILEPGPIGEPIPTPGPVPGPIPTPGPMPTPLPFPAPEPIPLPQPAPRPGQDLSRFLNPFESPEAQPQTQSRRCRCPKPRKRKCKRGPYQKRVVTEWHYVTAQRKCRK